MTIGALLAIIGAVAAIALAFRWASGCYRRHQDDFHAQIQGLCEFHGPDERP